MSFPRFSRRRASVVLLVAVATMGIVAGSPGRSSATSGLGITLQWTTGPLPDIGSPIAESSPNVVTLDGNGPSVVVGDRTGKVYAFHLSDGSPVLGWPVQLGAPVDSTPSVAQGPAGPEVLVGSGNAAEPASGGYQAIGANGSHLWYTPVVDPSTDNAPAYGVQASMSVGTLQGQLSTVAGSLDEEEYALNAASGSTLSGWPFFTSDSVFSTAAIGDLYGTGQNEIVEGSDQSAGYALGQTYFSGGHLRILNQNGGLICHYDANQTMDSSPAVGDFLTGGQPGIVLGTGNYFPGTSDTDTVKAFDTSCHPMWSTTLDGSTISSPALADVQGNGQLDVVEGTENGSTGSVWVLSGTTGQPMWSAQLTGEALGSVVTADLTGAGYQDLLVPTTQGVDIFDGLSHQLVTVLNGVGDPHGVFGFQNSPLVTVDPDGKIGITLAGYGCSTSCFGEVLHYQLPAGGANPTGAGAWPMFHHDPQLTGLAGTLGTSPACQIPTGALTGYDLVASDGGVFSFGGQPFCGSTGGLALVRPIVGAAAAAGSGGYWLVASDGGVFAFGGAQFFGSMGGRPLNDPIVGMAATPDGRGYWLVASDGGIFTFGDASFYGSTGSLRLKSPIVSMAANPDGLGYYLVASDGGVFAFGDAYYFGSAGGLTLAAPIVGMAVDAGADGYWLVSADGGVFSFGDAPFFGSTGGLRLAAPIVGVSALANGAGYRFVASDGGVFVFGLAGFAGSMGGTHLNQPVVAITGL